MEDEEEDQINDQENKVQNQSVLQENQDGFEDQFAFNDDDKNLNEGYI